ncbi:MAG: hypothetical protein LBS25_07810 [Candidatus Symbiothrix sp.]|jgi:hypothetical protein|nr:hypothetical protein [Candidatus Symbiothrix sp.]
MKRNIFQLIISSIILTAGFSSCLNDSDIEDQKYGIIDLNAKKIIEIPSNASHELNKTLLPEGIVELTLSEVRLAAENPAPEDIVVNLTTDKTAALLPDTEYFPLSEIEVPTSVTIRKGERATPIVVKVNTDVLTSDPQYLAISIGSVNKSDYVISGNFGDLKVSFKAKNPLEGRYVLSGTFTDITNTTMSHVTEAFSQFYPSEPYTVVLETVDGFTLIFYDEMIWADYMYPIYAEGWSGYGSFCPMFTFDENDIVEVTNAYGQPAAANTRSAEIDPAGVNKYDPATKSFTVSYWMNQSSVVVDPPHHRTHITETYTFLEDL